MGNNRFYDCCFAKVVAHLFIFLRLALAVPAAGSQGGVSIPYCSTYLCSRFPKSLVAYLNAGCEGDFTTYLSSKGLSSPAELVSPKSLTVLVSVSIIVGFLSGYIFGFSQSKTLRHIRS